MNSFLLKIKKIVSSFLIVAMTQMIVSPIFLNQTYAAATLSVSTEVPTPTNIVTPSYSFVSDTNGTIIY
jgi:hypothetical protein